MRTGSIIIFFIAFSFATFAQKKQPVALPSPQLPIDTITKKITYEEVVEVNGLSAEQLYKRALQWFHTHYKNPTEVIRENDSVKYIIVAKPRFRIYNPPDKEGTKTDAGVVQYSLTVAARDGRFRYEVTDFNWKQISLYPIERWYNTSLPSYTNVYNEYLRQTDTSVQSVFADLKNAMVNAKASKKEDW